MSVSSAQSPFLGGIPIRLSNQPQAVTAGTAHSAESPLAPLKADNVQFSSRLRFGAQLTDSPYHKVTVAADFNNGDSVTNIVSRLHDTHEHFNALRKDPKALRALQARLPELKLADWAKPRLFPKNRPQAVITPTVVHDRPLFNRDYAAFAVLQDFLSGTPNSQPHPGIIVHVTDPGVGKHGTDRTLLVVNDDKPGEETFLIGPNNGSLAATVQFLKNHGLSYQLEQLDLDAVEQLEKARVGEHYRTAQTFHGRDIFGAVAGYLAGGVDWHFFTNGNKPAVVSTPFFDEAHQATLPTQVGDSARVLAFRDPTSGNLRTNVALTDAALAALAPSREDVANNARYRFTYQPKAEVQSPHVATQRQLAPIVVEAPLGYVFADVPPANGDQLGSEVAYRGSSYAPGKGFDGSPNGHSRYLELSRNQGDMSAWFNLGPSETAELLVERIQ